VARLIAFTASYCEPHCDDHYSLISSVLYAATAVELAGRAG